MSTRKRYLCVGLLLFAVTVSWATTTFSQQLNLQLNLKASSGGGGGGGEAHWLENKPGTCPLITDYAFSAVIPTASSDQAMGDGSGWFTYYPTSARTTTRVVETGSVVSPEFAAHTLYEVGDIHGVGKVKFYRTVSSGLGYTGFYIALRVKWDSNYEWQPISNKLFYVEPGNIILQSRHNSGGIQRFNSVYVGGTDTDHTPDNNVTISLGQYHTIEYIVRRSASAGVLQVWLDGVQTMNKSGVNIPTTGETQELDINDTWGGNGDPRSRESERWVDHVYICGLS